MSIKSLFLGITFIIIVWAIAMKMREQRRWQQKLKLQRERDSEPRRRGNA
jgi:hypothetical protein